MTAPAHERGGGGVNTISLMLCVNNEYGRHTEKIDAIDLYVGAGENAMQLRGHPLTCRMWKQMDGQGYSIKIGHVGLWARGYSKSVGNVFWDSMPVRLRDAVRVVNYVRRRGWQCELGYEALFAKFEAGQDISEADLRRAMEVVQE